MTVQPIDFEQRRLQAEMRRTDHSAVAVACLLSAGAGGVVGLFGGLSINLVDTIARWAPTVTRCAP